MYVCRLFFYSEISLQEQENEIIFEHTSKKHRTNMTSVWVRSFQVYASALSSVHWMLMLYAIVIHTAFSNTL